MPGSIRRGGLCRCNGLWRVSVDSRRRSRTRTPQETNSFRGPLMHFCRQRRLCLLAAWIVCLTQPVAGPSRAAADEAKPEAPQVTFLDKAAAAKAVVDDSAEPYFDKL